MKKENALTYVLTGAIAVVLAVLIFLISTLFNKNEPAAYIESTFTPTPTVAPTPVPTPEIKTATVSAMGDLLMHLSLIEGAETENGYDFDGIFKHITPYISSKDYAVANLETTLCGLDNGYVYSGYPAFNCPDGIIKSVKEAGFDMLLTANNHSYDTRHKGMLRTLEVIDSEKLDRLGIIKSEEEKNYTVKNINGIKIGMICYTYETDNSKKVALNGIPLTDASKDLVNTFSYGELSDFYLKIKNQLQQMKSDGAEAFVLFIHWGEEYQLKQNENQEKIAQKMCDLGFDVIVGGHPHVVQPLDLITSTVDNNHKTVCLYSVGNAVSNQRRANMNLKTGHTEDGVIFTFSFTKTENEVFVSDVEVIPTWVKMDSSGNKNSYEIIPIESVSAFGDFSENVKEELNKSYLRTEAIIGQGLEKIKNHLK